MDPNRDEVVQRLSRLRDQGLLSEEEFDELVRAHMADDETSAAGIDESVETVKPKVDGHRAEPLAEEPTDSGMAEPGAEPQREADDADLLSRLTGLRDSGVLSGEEFQLAVEDLLGDSRLQEGILSEGAGEAIGTPTIRAAGKVCGVCNTSAASDDQRFCEECGASLVEADPTDAGTAGEAIGTPTIRAGGQTYTPIFDHSGGRSSRKTRQKKLVPEGATSAATDMSDKSYQPIFDHSMREPLSRKGKSGKGLIALLGILVIGGVGVAVGGIFSDEAATGLDVRSYFFNSDADRELDWSPDGRQMVFASDRDGDWEIYVRDRDGSVRQLTNNDYDDRNPVWSPDGKHIGFEAIYDGDWELLRMNTDGSDVRSYFFNSDADIDLEWKD